MVICLALALSLAGCTDYPLTPDASGIHTSTTPVSNGLSVSPATPTIAQGATVQLTASGSNGNVQWSSSAAAIATVSSAGLVSGVAPGTATITARQGNRWGTAVVTVTAPSGGVHSVEVSPDTTTVSVGTTTQKTAVVRDANGNTLTGHTITWSSSNTSVATVSSNGVVTAVAAGSASIRATTSGKSGTAAVTITTGAAPPPPSGNEIRVGGFTTQALQSALTQLANQGGGTLLFPAGTYDLRSWPAGGVRIDVPVHMVAEGTAILQGSGNAHLFDFGKQVHIQGLEFRNWLRPIRFYRTADWENRSGDSEYVHVVNSRFLDIAIAVEGRKESGSTPPSNAHRMSLLKVTGSRFERTRRAVDFRRVYIDRFEFTHNQVRDVIHRNPEPDVPLSITVALQIGSSFDEGDPGRGVPGPGTAATEVYIAHNDIRRVRNEDTVNGRAYAILAYRGPLIAEHNHIEDIVSGEDSDNGAAAMYIRSRTYARVAYNRIINGTSTSNVAAIFAKQGGAPLEVIENEIVFTDAFKDQHNSPEYTAFEATLADVRFEGNVVRGATRLFVTRVDSNNSGLPKTTQEIVRNNTFERCEARPNASTQRPFILGYRRTLSEVSRNRFINCAVRGGEFIFISGADNSHETDELRITNNEWTFSTAGLEVPSQVVRFNAYPRRAVISDNRFNYTPANPAAAPTPITFVFLPANLAGTSGARVTVSDNQMHGLRNGTISSITVLDSRAGVADLTVERNRVSSGGNFVRLSGTAPQRTTVRDNDVRGIQGQLVRRDVQGGELIVSGNTQ